MQRVILRGPDQVEHAKAFIDVAFSDDKLWEVLIQEHDPKRTRSQNDTFHMWCDDIARATGHTKTEIKERMKRQFLLPTTKTVMGRDVEVWPETSKMTKDDMSEFMNHVAAFAAEWGIAIRHPEDRW